MVAFSPIASTPIAALGSGVVLGTASLSGSGSETISGVVVYSASAALAGTGSLTCDALNLKLASADLSGTGTMTVTGAIFKLAAADLAGAGTLTATAEVLHIASAALSGSGSLTVSTEVLHIASASMTGTGTMTVSGAIFDFGVANLTATGFLGCSAVVITTATILHVDSGSPDIFNNLRGINATYSTARASGSPLNDSAIQAGQRLDSGLYSVYEALFQFDTSSIADNATVTAVTLKFWEPTADNSTQNFIFEVYAHDFGSTITSADWVPADDLDDLTKLATYDTASGFPSSDYWSCTSESAFPAAINKTGYTRLLACSDRVRNNTTPTTNEFITFSAYSGTDAFKARLLISYYVPNTITGAASLTGTGSETITAGVTKTTSASLSGTGTMTALGGLLHAASASLSGSGTMTVAAIVTYSASASLSGSGTLTALGGLTIEAAADLTGTGTLTVLGGFLLEGSADLEAEGTLAALGGLTVAGECDLAGSGSCDCSPAVVYSASAALDGLGALSAIPSILITGQASLSGSGSLACETSNVVSGAAELIGGGDLAASAILTYSAIADLTGTGSLSGSVSLTLFGAAEFSGQGGLTAIPSLTLTSSVTLSGLGTITRAFATVVPTFSEDDCEGPFCNQEEFLTYYSGALIGQLVADDGQFVSYLDNSDIVLAALMDASGEIMTAALAGERYTVCELHSLAGNHAAALKRLTAKIAYRHLAARRGRVFDQEAEPVLDLLRQGVRVFGTARAMAAGHAQNPEPAD